MEPSAIIELAFSLCIVVVPVVIGLTGAFKQAFPKVNPLSFSMPAGALLAALTWFATQDPPAGLMGWCVFVITTIIGALMPSGLFDAGVNMMRKARNE